MKINDEHQFNSDSPSSTQVVDSCMSMISELLIEPACERGEIDDEQAKILALIGITLQEVAQRAQAWDDQRKSNLNEHYRN